MPTHTPQSDAGIDVKDIPVSDLVALHTTVVNELLARKLARTRSAPAADLPLLLVAAAYQGELTGRHHAWDVETPDRRIVVRGRLGLPTDRPSAAFAPIPDGEFDAVVFVVIDAVSCAVVSAVDVPASRLAGVDESGSGRRIRVGQDLLDIEGARDVTTEIEKAMETLDAERFARRQSDAGSDDGDVRPTGWCLCGCGQRADPGARFLVMHDRRADSPVLRERYGTISGLVV